MFTSDSQRTLRSSLRRVDIWLAGISSFVLALLMVYIFAGAILRYAFNAPIVGGNEVVEMASVVIVMLGLPYCTTRESHIRIDLLDPLLGRIGKLVGDLIYYVLGVTVLGYLVSAYYGRFSDALEFDDQTNLLGIPLWPFYALVMVGIGSYAAILVIKFVGLFLTRSGVND